MPSPGVTAMPTHYRPPLDANHSRPDTAERRRQGLRLLDINQLFTLILKEALPVKVCYPNAIKSWPV